MTNPFSFPITSPYGARRTFEAQGRTLSDVHDGIDFAYPQGTPVTLPPGGEFDGTVIVAQLDQFGGGWIDVRSDKDGGVARFLHMRKIDVKVGQKIKSNHVLGQSGGKKGTYGAGLSTGPHLHIGLFVNNSSVDPLPWLKAAYLDQSIINSNSITMSEKQQLANFYKAKEAALKDIRFKDLFVDEQNAFGSYDGNKDDASDLRFLLSRILAQRERIRGGESALADLQQRYTEANELLADTYSSEEMLEDTVADLKADLMKKETALDAIEEEPVPTSSGKPFLQSKKFIALVTGAAAILAAQLSPELQTVTNELTILLVTYLAGQSSIDALQTIIE